MSLTFLLCSLTLAFVFHLFFLPNNSLCACQLLCCVVSCEGLLHANGVSSSRDSQPRNAHFLRRNSSQEMRLSFIALFRFELRFYAVSDLQRRKPFLLIETQIKQTQNETFLQKSNSEKFSFSLFEQAKGELFSKSKQTNERIAQLSSFTNLCFCSSFAKREKQIKLQSCSALFCRSQRKLLCLLRNWISFGLQQKAILQIAKLACKRKKSPFYKDSKLCRLKRRQFRKWFHILERVSKSRLPSN